MLPELLFEKPTSPLPYVQAAPNTPDDATPPTAGVEAVKVAGACPEMLIR